MDHLRALGKWPKTQDGLLLCVSYFTVGLVIREWVEPSLQPEEPKRVWAHKRNMWDLFYFAQIWDIKPPRADK